MFREELGVCVKMLFTSSLLPILSVFPSFFSNANTHSTERSATREHGLMRDADSDKRGPDGRKRRLFGTKLGEEITTRIDGSSAAGEKRSHGQINCCQRKQFLAKKCFFLWMETLGND